MSEREYGSDLPTKSARDDGTEYAANRELWETLAEEHPAREPEAQSLSRKGRAMLHKMLTPRLRTVPRGR